MEESGKDEDAMNEMFSFDSCSFSLWGAADGGGGGRRIEANAAVEEINDDMERKKRKQIDKDLGKVVIIDGGRGGGGGGGGGDEENGNGKDTDVADRMPEIHTQTERERRKRMRDMFSTLQVLVPHVTPKCDKSTIVEETIKYIKTLEQNLQILQDKKREKLMKQSKNVTNFNSFAPSSLTFIQSQHHHIKPQQMVSSSASSSNLISRASLLADHYHYYSSSSTSITPTNSTPTTPKSNLTSPLGSPPIMMINNNNNDIVSREIEVKIMLPPSSISFKTFTSENVVVSVCGREAQFNICGPNKSGLYTGICLVLEKFQLEIKTFQIYSDECSNLTMVTILARATALLDRYPVEEIYKAAGSEMLRWITSKVSSIF